MIEKIIDGIKEKYGINLRDNCSGYYNSNEIIILDRQVFEYKMLDYIYDEFGIDSEFYYEVDDGVNVTIELLL